MLLNLAKSDYFYQLFERIKWKTMEANLTKTEITINLFICLNSNLLNLFLFTSMFQNLQLHNAQNGRHWFRKYDKEANFYIFIIQVVPQNISDIFYLKKSFAFFNSRKKEI